MGGGPLNFQKEGVDVALHRIDFPIKPSWTVTHLFDEEMGPVMAHSMVENFNSGKYTALGSKIREEGWDD